jgi:hypothetical protein
MGHPRDPNSHSHHNSVWISHHDVAGVDFWGDRGLGRIVHQRVLEYEDADHEAVIEVQNAWIDANGKVLLEERRRMSVLPRENDQWLLVIGLQLSAPRESVTLGKTPFGMVGVRMAKTIGVHDGGGRILNSQGDLNEQGAFWKRAKWVDYSGPITPAASEGVTLMDHPANPNHPSYFHVRDDGWMGASLTFDSPHTIDPTQPLVLRYGLHVHAGVSSQGQIEQTYRHFVDLPIH